TTLGPFSGRLTDVPSIQMTPQTGADFFRGLVVPLPLERLALLVANGWDLERLLRLFVAEMNGLENAPHPTGAGAERGPRFSEFAEVARVLGHLHHEGLLELAPDPKPVLLNKLSDPFTGHVGASEVANAAKDNVLYVKVPPEKPKGDGKPE